MTSGRWGLLRRTFADVLTDIEHEIEPAGGALAGVRDPHQQCALKEAIALVRGFVWKIELRGEQAAARRLNLDVIVPCAAGIDRRRDGTETKSAVGPGGDMAAISEIGIVVFALVVRMPEVDHGAAKRAAASRQHKAGKFERPAACFGLAEVAALRPKTLNELSSVPGVGPTKLERYGEDVLAALSAP